MDNNKKLHEQAFNNLIESGANLNELDNDTLNQMIQKEMKKIQKSQTSNSWNQQVENAAMTNVIPKLKDPYEIFDYEFTREEKIEAAKKLRKDANLTQQSSISNELAARFKRLEVARNIGKNPETNQENPTCEWKPQTSPSNPSNQPKFKNSLKPATQVNSFVPSSNSGSANNELAAKLAKRRNWESEEPTGQVKTEGQAAQLNTTAKSPK